MHSWGIRNALLGIHHKLCLRLGFNPSLGLALGFIFCLLGLAWPMGQGALALSVPKTRPMRIVSLDGCADLYVVTLVERERIAALSQDADRNFVQLGQKAKGLGRTSDDIEAILAQRPDLVVRSWGGGARLEPLLKQAGIPLLEIGFINNFNEINPAILRIADGLGSQGQGQALVQSLKVRHQDLLAQTQRIPKDKRPRAIYLAAAGAVAGGQTFVDEIITLGGARNLLAEEGVMGFPDLNLELLVMKKPDLWIGAFFDDRTHDKAHWGVAQHPVLKGILTKGPSVYLPGHLMACPSWTALEAAEKVFKATQHWKSGVQK